MTSFYENLGDFGPLRSGRIDTGGIVGAGVEEDNGLRRGGSEEGEVGGETESDRGWIVVGVFYRCTTDVGEDRFVVG